ncbi:MAG: aminoacyl-tRNA hydrolase [Lentisphaeraceae bacterium]|nr:aminoacyl-tRNA hydrolase [Lentisphaeraceae bacterium]
MSEEDTLEPLTDIKLVVGLGNPGSQYAATRHNIGFMVIDRLLRDQSVKVKRQCQSEVAEYLVGSRSIILQKPLTYMNSSGDAVKKLCRRMKVKPSEVLVVYDDLDIKPGRMRIRFGGGSGGHNGIKSITARFGSGDYGRIKVGIGRPGSVADVVDYVLQDFSEQEKELIETVVDKTAEAVLMLCNEGYGAAMNTFNGQTFEVSGQPNQE